MRAFEVSVNGDRLCLAGIDGAGVLNVIIDSFHGNARDHLDVKVGGLVSATGEHVRWARTNLSVGDQVNVRVLDVDSVNEPTKRFVVNPAEDLENQKISVRAIIKEL